MDTPGLIKNAFFAQAIGGTGSLERGANEYEFFRRLFNSGLTISSGGVITLSSAFFTFSPPLTVPSGGTGIASFTAGDLITATGATTLAALNAQAVGKVLISNGTSTLPSYSDVPTVTTISAQGVIFPATQVPSGGANTLDDYEEGTWTPTDASGAALTFTGVVGFYVKIGQLVIASADLTYPATADGSNSVIGGLPFTIAATATNIWGGFFTAKTEATADTLVGVANSTTVVPLTSAGANITNATLSGDRLRFVLCYRATA